MLRRPLVQNKLLDDAENHTAADANRCAADNKSCAAVLAGIVGIRERPGGQVAQDVRVVDLSFAVVSSGEKRSCHGVQKAGFRRARTLVEVARILMQ